MARMIPKGRPEITGSFVAEPDIYWRLSRQLPDDFTVIHSLPWLAQAAQRVDGRKVPTGEVDFLILHGQLGILALEIKGGVVAYNQTRFVLRDGTEIDPIRQVRRGVHSLETWIKAAGFPQVRFGYGLVLPHSDLLGRPIPPALQDLTASLRQSIALDKNDINRLGEKIIGLMQYWKSVLGSKPLHNSDIDCIVKLLCPIADYSPSWASRIKYDRERWLALTEEQNRHLDQLLLKRRVVVTGRGGTGKTILGVTAARKLAVQGKHVLFLVFNNELAQHLKQRLADTTVQVTTFHKFCLQFKPKSSNPTQKKATKSEIDQIPSYFISAMHNGFQNSYDTLIIDEGQAFQAKWLKALEEWFRQRVILVFCDETQVFKYEEGLSLNEIVTLTDTKRPFMLTVNMRSPRAIFDRLKLALPSEYEQFSPREDDIETINEIVTFDPLKQLYVTLTKLHEQGVPREDIVITYIGKAPLFPSDIPSWYRSGKRPSRELFARFTDVTEAAIAKDQERMAKQFGRDWEHQTWIDRYPKIGEMYHHRSYIGTFRGLEAPIVIVYVDGYFDEASIACAYSRSTTYCSAIYAIRSFFDDSSDGGFRKILLETPNIRNIIGSMWPPTRNMNLLPVVTQTATVLWSEHWNGLFIWRGLSQDIVANALWIYHLMTTFDISVYHLQIGSAEGSIVNRYSREFSTDDELRSGRLHTAWCKECNRWTINDFSFQGMTCKECDTRDMFFQTPNIIAHVNSLEQILLNPGQYTTQEKRQLSPYLILLGYWRTLPEQDYELAVEYSRRLERSLSAPFALACRVLVLIELLRSPAGTVLNIEGLTAKYKKWMGEDFLLDEQWKRLIQNAFKSFTRIRWATKLPRSNDYVRSENTSLSDIKGVDKDGA